MVDTPFVVAPDGTFSFQPELVQDSCTDLTGAHPTGGYVWSCDPQFACSSAQFDQQAFNDFFSTP